MASMWSPSRRAHHARRAARCSCWDWWVICMYVCRVCIYIYIYIHITYIHMYTYISLSLSMHIYIYREREREISMKLMIMIITLMFDDEDDDAMYGVVRHGVIGNRSNSSNDSNGNNCGVICSAPPQVRNV